MTNLLLEPVQRTVVLGRRAVATATRLSAPVLGPLASSVGAARRAVEHAPALALGAVEQLGGRLPAGIGEQLPVRQGEVAALEARVARLEAAAAAPKAAAKATPKASSKAAPKAAPARRTARA